MTRVALPQTPAAAPAPSLPVKTLFQGFLPIGQIDVVSNIRKTFNEAALAELTASVAEHGIDQPILLRPYENGRYALVDGERRFRAAKAAKLAEVPVIVKDYTAEQALIAQAISFLQRDGLAPIEEARGFELLMRGGKDGASKYTVDQIAARLGKSVRYVYRAVALLELPKDALDAIAAGKLTPAHGHQLLRVPPFKRQDLVDDLLGRGDVMTAAELRHHVEAQLGCDLAAAAFPKDKPFAGALACTGCPSNTGNQGALFDGAVKGTCMNKPCFATKAKQHRADFLEKVLLAHTDAKFVEYAGGYIYAGTRRMGGYVVKAPLDPKKAPKGDFGLMISSNFEVWVAALDKKAAAAEVEAAATPAPADPKEAFVTKAIGAALYVAAAQAAKKFKFERKDWAELAIDAAEDLPTGLWAAILGIQPDAAEDRDDDTVFAKAPEAALRAIVLMNQRLPYSPGDADFKKLGVDVAKVKKEATATAEKDWLIERAGAGLEWPKNIVQVDKAVLAAVHQTQGAAKRWAKDAKTGLSEKSMTERVAYELPTSGGGASKELTWNAEAAGFKVWLGSRHGEPSLKGHATVARVRILLGIPYRD